MNDRFMIRRKNLRNMIKKEGIHSFLVTDFINVSYLTGFAGDDSYLLITEKDDIIISDFRYTEQIENECPGLTAYIRPVEESMDKATRKLLKGTRKKQLGVEADSITLTVKEQFAQTLDDWEIAPTRGLVEKLRMVKDKWEIAEINQAIHVAARAFAVTKASLRAEQTEIDVRNFLETQMKLFGADGFAFSSIVAVGPWAALCHAIPGNDRTVAQGELLLFDWGAKVNGYLSDNTRTVITTKKPSAKLRKIYDIVLNAHLTTMKAVAPGKKCSDIDAIARGIIKDAGYGKYFGHGLGHSFGMQVHENPRFNSISEHILEPGNVMTVEPGIYLPGWGGIRIEDDVLVTKTGYEILGPSIPKQFDEMMVEID